MSEAESLPLVGRRKALGLGIASGVALAAVPTQIALAKVPFKPNWSPEYKAALALVMKKNWKGGVGIWAVAYSGDNYTGDPMLIGTPGLKQKPQAGPMPDGWGFDPGSIVVGGGAVLRLFHQVNGQDSHITLLPGESVARLSAMSISDGQSSWKLYPCGDLHPPY